jgi:hypothetical protein
MNKDQRQIMLTVAKAELEVARKQTGLSLENIGWGLSELEEAKEGLSTEQIDDLLKRHFDLDWPDKWAYRENAIAAMQEFHERMHRS